HLTISFSFPLLRLPPCPPLFPYTTLFRSDSLPGLTIDRFEDVLVAQVLSVGMEKLQSVLFEQLAEILAADGLPVRGIYLRNDVADRKSTRLNSSHVSISYAVFCLKKKRHR